MANKQNQVGVSFVSPQAKFALVLLAVIFLTVVPHYIELYEAPEAVSPALAFHGMAYLGWYVLFALQAGLIAAGNIRLHRTLGGLSLGLMAVLVFSGTAMLLGVMQSYQAEWSEAHHMARTSFVWAIAHTLVTFILFYGLGLWFRRRSAFHKRFMLLASLTMISASITRIAYLPFVPIDGTAVTLLGTYALLATPLVIDRVVEGKVHPVLKWGVPAYAVTQLMAIAWAPATELGRALAFPF